MLLRFVPIDSCRGDGWEKRDIDDIEFGRDSDGNFIVIMEAKWTKTLKDADAVNNERNTVKIYQRADRLGLYEIVREVKGLRPQPVHTKAALDRSLFLYPRRKINFLDGFQVGYYNKPMGRSALKKLWSEICRDFGIDEYNINSLRTSMASLAVDMNLAFVANTTNHKSVALIDIFKLRKLKMLNLN